MNIIDISRANHRVPAEGTGCIAVQMEEHRYEEEPFLHDNTQRNKGGE
jgi:hypothetical protein